MASGCISGVDGLPVDFYKKFWTIIGPYWYNVLHERLCAGELPLSCSRAGLTLLLKKSDLSDLWNWRPVVLLRVDFKIYSKTLANRLKGHQSFIRINYNVCWEALYWTIKEGLSC